MRNFFENLSDTTKGIVAVLLAIALTGECVSWILMLALGLPLGQATALGQIGAYAAIAVFGFTGAILFALFGCEP